MGALLNQEFVPGPRPGVLTVRQHMPRRFPMPSVQHIFYLFSSFFYDISILNNDKQ